MTGYYELSLFSRGLGGVNPNAGNKAALIPGGPLRACTNCVRAKAKCSPGVDAEGPCER